MNHGVTAIAMCGRKNSGIAFELPHKINAFEFAARVCGGTEQIEEVVNFFECCRDVALPREQFTVVAE